MFVTSLSAVLSAKRTERPAVPGGASSRLMSMLRYVMPVLLLLLLIAATSAPVFAQGGEAELKLPDLHAAIFMGGVSGPTILYVGLGVSVLGLIFGLAMYKHLRDL